MPDYTPADFPKPKVSGLAIHNAQLAENKARQQWGDNKSIGYLPLEIQAYCLFLVRKDASVEAIGASATAGDFAGLVRVQNLALLAKKYGAIGFVTKRTPKSKAEWSVIAMLRK